MFPIEEIKCDQQNITPAEIVSQYSHVTAADVGFIVLEMFALVRLENAQQIVRRRLFVEIIVVVLQVIQSGGVGRQYRGVERRRGDHVGQLLLPLLPLCLTQLSRCLLSLKFDPSAADVDLILPFPVVRLPLKLFEHRMS